MDKALQLDVHRFPDAPDLGKTQLPGQDDPGKTQLLRQTGPLGVVDAHLGGGMAGQIRHMLPEQGSGGQVLEDHRVRAGLSHLPHRVPEGGQLGIRHQGVHRHMDPHAPAVTPGHRFLQLVFPEIIRLAPGIEALGAQVDRIRAAVNGGDQLFPAPGGGQDLHQSITRTAVITGWSFFATVPLPSCTGVFSAMASTTSIPEVTRPKAA